MNFCFVFFHVHNPWREREAAGIKRLDRQWGLSYEEGVTWSDFYLEELAIVPRLFLQQWALHCQVWAAVMVFDLIQETFCFITTLPFISATYSSINIRMQHFSTDYWWLHNWSTFLSSYLMCLTTRFIHCSLVSIFDIVRRKGIFYGDRGYLGISPSV